MLCLPDHFRKKSSQAIHIVAMPLSFFAFMLIYRPFDVVDAMQLGQFSFGVNLTLISCIILGTTLLMRGLFHLVRRRIDRLTYFFWCLLEMTVGAFSVALYAWLMEQRVEPYFLVVARSCTWLFPVLVFPYVITTLALFLVAQYRNPALNQEATKLRFYDERHNLKLAVDASSVLYIAAEENYVNIFYVDGDTVRNYLMRTSMRAIEGLCQKGGLLRCHRSFYLNPQHVKALRRDRAGVILAELDLAGQREIPVTKRYYDQIAAAI